MGSKGLYTIYDKIACEMGPVMVYNNDDQARRVYPQAFKGEKKKMSDFMLCRIGWIDTETMLITLDATGVEDVTPFVGGDE